MRTRVIALSAAVVVWSLVGASAAIAVERPSTAAWAEFRACMKKNGAPTLDHRLSADERAALKKAYAACRGLLPKPKRPSAAQVAAFESCMADKGFTSTAKPNLRDPAVRKALWDAIKQCMPLLKPK
jgi:hypothetical protein